jgi:type II secretory pathway component GspD/PulD (secretin)
VGRRYFWKAATTPKDKKMKSKRLRNIALAVIGGIIALIVLGAFDRATEETVKRAVTGIPANEIPSAPEWTTETPIRSSGQAIQIVTRFIEVPKGASKLNSSGIQVMSPEESTSFIQNISSQRGTDLLSAPIVVTRDGVSALIQVGQEFVVPSGGAEKGNLHSADLETVDLGVKSHFRPRLSEAGDSIKVDVFAQLVTSNGFLDGEESVETARFECTTVSTAASIPPGQTAVLGGKFLEQQVIVQDAVPILGSIPFLGRLFRSTTIESNPREFIMTITPTLMSDAKI